MSDMKIYEELVSLAMAGLPSSLATVVESSGSSPRKAGAKMLVRGDGSILGTVGGGRVELETIEAALEAMQSGHARTLSFTLTEEYGHVCGGRILVYVEPAAITPRLVIIGAGHVGKALAAAAKLAGFRVAVADDRPEYVTAGELSCADETFVGDAAGALAHFGVDAATFVVITTTGFEKDFAAVRAALATPARYIGVIGSRRKRDVLEQTLMSEGFEPRDIARLMIPVGLSIGAETPAEIAVSIVSQLIQVRRSHGAAGIGDTPGRRAIAADGELQAAPAAP